MSGLLLNDLYLKSSGFLDSLLLMYKEWSSKFNNTVDDFNYPNWSAAPSRMKVTTSLVYGVSTITGSGMGTSTFNDLWIAFLSFLIYFLFDSCLSMN